MLSQDINKLEGFFVWLVLYVCVCFCFFLYATTVVNSINSAPQHSLYFNSFWTENELKAKTTIRNAILLQVYEKLSPSESTVVCVSNTCLRIICSFRHISVGVSLQSTATEIVWLMNRLVCWSAALMECIFSSMSITHQTQTCDIWRHA